METSNTIKYFTRGTDIYFMIYSKQKIHQCKDNNMTITFIFQCKIKLLFHVNVLLLGE